MNQMTSSTYPAWPSGFRVNPRVSALSAELIAEFASVPVCHAGDVMGRHTGSVGLSVFHNDLSKVMCGPAVTVRTRPGDNLMIHLAMMMAEPGDVIVIDCGGDVSTAVIGGLMRTTAVARKLGGFVLDGALRDVAEWSDGAIPAYAKGAVLRGPSKEGPGEVNVPVSCAGLAVSPDDLMLGGGDGVICIPAADAAAVLRLCRAHAEKEAMIAAKNAQGKLDWDRFNAILRAKGCPV
ncbi:Regulator of RNase E activity RraA [Paracoccus alcaliphilus]|uniref:Putative 4-hydroxy-4-methyl-2-oxoglutarate aldolase n=1 Tax=Paracoccus alcaliphilus TaxID=34002 RepID=A0A1H8J5M1_9RHOB|nr:RraA family protein [Paracoccus alcaliphilus]WCR16679.1 RraA family protein [Paracoccus alcaliphilus]SEN75318.1 Regulator of RNase E activity RraA [Paracoccus alcaliphilus]